MRQLDVEQLKRDLVPMKNEIFMNTSQEESPIIVKDFSVAPVTGKLLVCCRNSIKSGEVLSNTSLILFEP
jgi:hypothetical protein